VSAVLFPRTKGKKNNRWRHVVWSGDHSVNG
jgi:hypothetical protein